VTVVGEDLIDYLFPNHQEGRRIYEAEVPDPSLK
jgi:hypothetical protein